MAYAPFARLDHRGMQLIAQPLQSKLSDLVAFSAVSPDVHKGIRPMVVSLRVQIWHSSHIDVIHWLVWAGEPRRWLNHYNSACLEMYEAVRDNPETKLRELSEFRPGEHNEPFNKLHGYYVLGGYPQRGRYQGCYNYPYIGMSETMAANCVPELCIHPPDDEDLAIILAFVCPRAGIYLISDVSFRLFDARARGPVNMDVLALRAGLAAETLSSLSIRGRFAWANVGEALSLTLNKGDRIAFSLSLGEEGAYDEDSGFWFGATRVSWKIRQGMYHN